MTSIMLEEAQKDDAEFMTRTAWILESSALMRLLADPDNGDDTTATERGGGDSLRVRVQSCYPHFMLCGADEKDWRLASTVVHQWSVAPLPHWFLDLFMRCPAPERPDMCAGLFALAQDAGEGTAAQAFWRGMLALVDLPLHVGDFDAITRQSAEKASETKEEGEVVVDDANDCRDIDMALGFWRIVKACSVFRSKEKFNTYWTDHCMPQYIAAGCNCNVLRHLSTAINYFCFLSVVMDPRCPLALAMTLRQFPVFPPTLREMLYDSGWIAGLDMLYAETGDCLMPAPCPATFCWALSKSIQIEDLLGGGVSRTVFGHACAMHWLKSSVHCMLRNGTFHSTDWTELLVVCTPSTLFRAFMYYAVHLCDTFSMRDTAVTRKARWAYDSDAETNRVTNDAFLQQCTMALMLQHRQHKYYLNFMDIRVKMITLNDVKLLMWPAVDSEAGARMFFDHVCGRNHVGTLFSTRPPSPSSSDEDGDDEDDNMIDVGYCRNLWDLTVDLRTFGWFQNGRQLLPLAVRLSQGIVCDAKDGKCTMYLSIPVKRFMLIMELQYFAIPHTND